MNDVVELAKQRRARIVAEIARLDRFMRMAEVLMDETEPGEKSEPADAESDDPVTEDELLLTDALPGKNAQLDIRVGKMIRHRRWMMGISQEQLSEMVEIPVAHVREFETGTRHASTSVLRNIALAMNVPMSFFHEELDESVFGDDALIESLLGEK
ncbi:MAG TPA: helix-turn-helix transcriptional regulator [Thermohalobaculum sp.]|nr:helix-turn-helix transcriptional regulator [Thermohalobaculum sp.]